MINSWTLKNFKSVAGKTTLDFAPLTIFAGSNSSGKSTIIQSILMIAQTIQNSVRSKSVILNGHMVKLGTFDDILSNKSSEKIISVGFTITPNKDVTEYKFHRYAIGSGEEIKKLVCEFSFSAFGARKDLLQLQPKLEELNLKITRNDPRIESKDSESEISISRSNASIESKLNKYELQQDELNLNEITSLEYDVNKPRRPSQIRHVLRSEKTIGEFAGATLYHFLPQNLTLVYDIIEEKKRVITEMIVNPRQYKQYEVLENIDDFFNDKFKIFFISLLENISNEYKGQSRFLEAFIKALTNLKDDFTYANIKKCYSIPIFQQLFTQRVAENKDVIKGLIDLGSNKKNGLDIQHSYFYDVIEFVDEFYRRSIKYLGPLRDEPKPIYPLMGAADPSDIGLKGENTASVLDIHKETIINYIKPVWFEGDLQKKEVVSDTLGNAVFEWLSYMGVAKSVVTSDKGKLGHEMKITTQGSESEHELTHVGVGVSQVLPILVLSLLADEDSCLIFEQPELHLHPKVQTRLADFFSSMLYLNKQCIVETHSEYLINRLRYLIALSDKDDLSSKINIYFVEKNQDKSVYNKLLINRYGTITNWPKGFFDENEKNASSIIRAAMEKKRKDESLKK